MKFLCMFLLPFLLMSSVLAQGISKSASPIHLSNQQGGVEVIEQRWSMRVHIPILDEDPLQDIYDSNKEMRIRKETLQQDKARSQLGMPVDVRQTQAVNEEIPSRPGDPRAIYSYSAKVKNNTGKEIQHIVWDYIFFAPDTNVEVGRRQFASKIKISSGKTGDLKMQSPSPPTGSVSAKSVKKSHPKYDEQIVIQIIQYADGTIWKANQ